ncbi:MAG TPA: FtsX-like permease family protein [Nevskiaceae bacterium]|nr:FtsX-like permease family protein [Nevskiaceae bacterium]
MKYFYLIWAQLWRKKLRTWLTVMSLVTAFLLLGLLQAADALFNGSGVNLSAPILIAQARVSFTNPLPMRLLPQIEAIPGVEAVSHSQFFGGVYQDVNNRVIQFAVNPERWLKVFPECVLPPAQELAWKQNAAGIIAGQAVADRFHWKVGDRIPLVSQIFPKKDGSRAWEFDLVGIFGDRSKESCPRLNNMYISYTGFDEARQFGRGMAGIYVIRIHNPDDAQRIAAQVDAMTENSPDETKTQTERDFTLNFAKQVGNLSLIFNLILFAVFFSILMLTGNTMWQAVRERVPELAVLKTIGFTDGEVVGLVLAESLLMCVLGGTVGMLAASGVLHVLARLPTGFPPPQNSVALWVWAVVVMLLLGLIIGVLPALRAKRLSIVDALAGR